MAGDLLPPEDEPPPAGKDVCTIQSRGILLDRCLGFLSHGLHLLLERGFVFGHLSANDVLGHRAPTSPMFSGQCRTEVCIEFITSELYAIHVGFARDRGNDPASHRIPNAWKRRCSALG